MSYDSWDKRFWKLAEAHAILGAFTVESNEGIVGADVLFGGDVEGAQIDLVKEIFEQYPELKAHYSTMAKLLE